MRAYANRLEARINNQIQLKLDCLYTAKSSSTTGQCRTIGMGAYCNFLEARIDHRIQLKLDYLCTTSGEPDNWAMSA